MIIKALGFTALVVCGIYFASAAGPSGRSFVMPEGPPVSRIGAAAGEPDLGACVAIADSAMDEAEAMDGRGDPQANERLHGMRSELREAGCDPNGLLDAFEETLGKEDGAGDSAAAAAGDMEPASLAEGEVRIQPGQPMVDVSR